VVCKKKVKRKKEPYHRRKRAHLTDTRNKEIKKIKKKKNPAVDAKEPYY
jgi:hypothetical protein